MDHAENARPARSAADNPSPAANDKPGQAPTLSRERIIRGAITLLDADGLSGLSMRRLADRLDAGAMSLYWYFSTKDELLRATTDAVLAEIRLRDLPEDWRAAVRALASDLRSAIQRHPWLRHMLSSEPTIGQHGLAVLETMLSTLAQAGLGGRQLDYAATTILSYILGFAVGENVWNRTIRAATPEAQASWADALARHPRIASFATDAEIDPDQRFITGIDLILAGVTATAPGPD